MQSEKDIGFIYIYIHTYVCIYVYAYVCIYIYVYIRIYVCIYTYIQNFSDMGPAGFGWLHPCSSGGVHRTHSAPEASTRTNNLMKTDVPQLGTDVVVSRTNIVGLSRRDKEV